MKYPRWANNSADDPTFDHLIEQAELDELWKATAPDEPTLRGRHEDRVYGDPREGSISAWRRGVDTDWDWEPDVITGPPDLVLEDENGMWVTWSRSGVIHLELPGPPTPKHYDPPEASER